MMETPNQHEVDAVAHFVQAVRELKASPLFIEERRDLGVTYNDVRDGHVIPVTYRLPDPCVRDAMVISFRRIWMAGEPANFERVCSILKRYVPQRRPLIDCFKDSCQQARKTFIEPKFMMGPNHGPAGISPEDVIDMWLNCRLAHVGATATKGRFTRSDYEREAKRLGEARFEYLFLTACFLVGLWYGNLLRFAEDILSKWASEGLKPSFILEDGLSCPGARACEDGVRLERATPGMTVSADDFPTRLKLLRRRRAFSGIDQLLRMVSDNNSCVNLLRASADVQSLLKLAGFDGQRVGDFSDMEGASQFSTISDDLADTPCISHRNGMLARFGSIIQMQGNALEILEEQLVLLKEQLFGGTGSTPPDGNKGA
jgi:hypothetical protein